MESFLKSLVKIEAGGKTFLAPPEQVPVRVAFEGAGDRVTVNGQVGAILVVGCDILGGVDRESLETISPAVLHLALVRIVGKLQAIDALAVRCAGAGLPMTVVEDTGHPGG